MYIPSIRSIILGDKGNIKNLVMYMTSSKKSTVMRFSIILILLTCYSTRVNSAKSHPITTLINAKWNQTPFALEIAEYLADENSYLFWDYIDNLSKLDPSLDSLDTELKQYKASIKAAESILNPTQIPLLKLSLSLHYLSPRVQAHLQIALDVLKNNDCLGSSFLNIGDKVVCDSDLSQINQIIEQSSSSKALETFSFDHIYPSSENNTITVIHYGQIGTSEFNKIHKILKSQAKKGNIKYVIRHYVKNSSNKKVRLSGYGVELHLKSTEYKSQDDSPKPESVTPTDENENLESEVEGFNFKQLKQRYPTLVHSLDKFRNSLLEKYEEIAPLKAWEFQELGLQAAEKIASIQGEESLQILQLTAQNFPTQAKSLLHTTVSEAFKKEMRHNIEILGRNLNLQPPDAALFVNGLFFDADTIDIATLLETLRTELRVLDGLHSIGLQGQTSSPLLALDLTSTSKEFAIDIRDSAVIWVNDIEKDAQYKRWPSSVMDLLRPTFPGMLRNIRKNMFNLILVVDPITPSSRSILKLSESFIVHTAPLRLGLVFDTRNEKKDNLENDYRAMICAFNYVTQQKTAREALGFLTDIYASLSADSNIEYNDIKYQLKKLFTKLTNEQVDDIIGEDSDFDYGRQLSMEFLDRLGMSTTPQALLNGVPLTHTSLNNDDFEEVVLTEIMQQTSIVQKAVYRGELTDTDNIIDYLMKQPHVMPRLNQRILSSDDFNFLDISGKPNNNIENVNILAKLSNRDMTATLMSNLKYFTNKNSLETILGNSVHFQTYWIIGDLNTNSGKALLINALEYMKSNRGIRIAFIPNADGTSILDKAKNLNNLVWAASHTLGAVEATDVMLKWLLTENNDDYVIPKPVRDLLSSTELHMKLLRTYCQRVLLMKSSENAVIANGRILGPLNEDEVFSVEDLNLLERYGNHHYGDKIRKALNDVSNDVEEIKLTSDIILKLISILVPRQQSKNRFTIPPDLLEDHTVVKLPPKLRELPYFDIVAVLDPASRGAQKLAPILIMLRNVINCRMRLVLCAIDKHSDMPIKNFYRFVIEPELQFIDDKLESGPIAKFSDVPQNSLFTQNLQVPENWLVEVVRSVYDLDNIKLQEINGPVHSEYELEHLLLEGHCFDTTSGAPPRGLQITLGTEANPVIVDTIVMANLGYFQLKANPGSWILKLRHGKSADIYDIASVEGPNTVQSSEFTRVIISSLKSHVLKLRVTKKAGHANADLLVDENDVQSGIWDSITSSFGGGSDQQSETINIFSLASGHLYERLLRIMMLSVLKHTTSPVKFWFLKNYLSPQFIDFLPHMAKEYGIQYELVQYKWPRWLHQQTEKQRTIWGYKILFLDVLFPLDVKKIIFVDADAIVRADIKELNTMDLGGAPYAYTPFCDSRKEMEGFRFWKQGYWRNHLQGRKYHISALYVVDLKKFRKIAAGDRLRGQYQALSQDPNSLSNLDQDLPNNMIHQVAIKSLPQEWLWCETWCNSDALPYAKTIDLCNNPQTKEAKLTAAQRIVPEWKNYDAEIKNLMIKVDAYENEHEDHSEGTKQTKNDRDEL